MDLRALARYVFCSIPGKSTIITVGATLPPSMRNALVLRILSAIATRCISPPDEVITNLGIHRRLHVKISSAKPTLLFGAPSLFIGERSSLDLALALFQHSSYFIDVGSNIGLYVFYLRFHDLSTKPIYFFEPDPALFSQLEANIRRNRLQQVQGYQLALADKAGKAVFFRNKTDDSSGSLIKEDWSQHVLEPIEVCMTSFGDFVQSNNLDHICAKVDVEGAEEAFFEGANSRLDRLDYLIMEVLGPAIRRGLPSKIIKEGRFHGYYINDYDLEYSSSGEYKYVAPFYNWLFCRDDPTELRTKIAGTKFRIIEKPR